MYKSSTPQDGFLFASGATTYAGTGAVTWASTGLAYIDTLGMTTMSMQVVGAHTSTIQPQWSNDLVTWLSVGLQNDGTVPLAENTSIANAVGIFSFQIKARYFRINISVYTSSPTLYVYGKPGNTAPATQPTVGILEAGSAAIGTVTAQPGNTANTTAWLVNTKVDLTPSAPTAASVGVASAQAVAAAATRKGLVLTNTSSNTISLGFGNAAVLNSGITLVPNGVFSMDEYSFDVGAVNAIASGATSNLAIQEFLT